MKVKIGVLALQGSVAEHISMLSMIAEVQPVEVKTPQDLAEVSGLIIPGGESTTIGKLLKEFKLEKPIKEAALSGMPVWGTCAGMIILAKDIIGEDYTHLGLMDISVRRNAYGSQLDSFSSSQAIPAVSSEEIPLVFIRAPWVESVGENVQVLARVNNRIVAARQDNLIATSFHPELTKDISFHKYFAQLVRTSN